MARTRAVRTHDQERSPTRKMPQGGVYDQRQPEHASEASPLHRYLGNSYVQAMTTKTQRLGLQTKLTVNEPGDIYEQEAHRIADQAMAAPTHANISSAPLQIQRFSESSAGQEDAAPASVAQTLASPGSPLEPALRQDMEQRFGYDFSDVRVHTGADAEQSARDVHARAYTMGHHIVFSAGRFAPETTEGRRLIAHELTHVAQMSAFGSPSSLTAALRLPILRQPESGADAAAEERRRVRASLAVLDSIPMLLPLTGDVRAAIQWAEKQQIKFEDPDFTEEERTYIARGLLRAFEQLRELEGKGERDPDGALVYSRGMSDPQSWTPGRARKLDDIAPFSAANIAEWRKAEAWQPPVTSVAKRPPRKKTSPQKRPAEPPERPSFAVNITFPKQEGMTFETEEGQQRIAFALIRSTRSGYTDDQIAWAVSRIDLSKWWAPGNLDLPTWRKNFEATSIGDKVTMGLSERFTLELDNILRERPTQHAIQVELGRQAVLSAAPTTYLAYAAPAGLMAGTIIGSGLAFLPGAGTVGGGGLTTGGGGALASGEGSLLLGGTIRQSALYAARHLYLNAPRLYGEASFWGGTIVSSVALAEHIREIRERGLRWSDAPRFVQDLFPFFHGNYERYSFRGGGPQSPREGPPVAGPKPVPAKVPPVTPPPAPTGPRMSIRRPVDVTHGKPFNVPLVPPTAPAPSRPVMPPVATGRTVAPPASVKPTPPAAPVQPPTASTVFRPKPWLLRVRDKYLAAKIRGVVESTELPEISGTSGTRPATMVTAKAPPSSPAPTPDLPSSMLTPPRVVSPARIVTRSAPTPSPTSVGTVRSPAPAPTTPSVTTAPSAGAVAISQMIDEATAGLPHPGSRPLDPSRMRPAVLSPQTQAHARQQWDDALFPLAQGRTREMIPVIDVEGVRFHEVEVSWNGSELRVGYFGIERTTAPGGGGEEIQEALERAAIQVAQRAGASSVRVFARTVVNDRWRETLNARGYNAHMMAHEHGFANVQARLFPIARPTGGRAAPAASVTAPTPAAPTPPGSTLPGPTSSGSTLPRSRASSVTPPGTTTRVEHATLSGTAPSQAPAVPVSAFIPPGPVRVLYRQDYEATKITKGANQGKLLLTHKTTGEQFLFKPRSGEREIIGSEAGIRAGERYRRAPAAAYLAREAGIRTPAAEIVIWNDNGIEEIGSLQQWITEGQPASRFYLHPEVYNAMAASQPKLDLDAFDYVIANMDRNPGNWKVIIDPQTNAVREVLPIDMDASLPPGPGRYSLGYVLEHYQEPMPTTISRGLYNSLLRMQADRSRIEIALREWLEQAEIDGVFTRLNELLESVRTGNIDVVP
jgi:hypothetical protein